MRYYAYVIVNVSLSILFSVLYFFGLFYSCC